jgi:3-hydroxy-3-methylglutaryl CoA synthase
MSHVVKARNVNVDKVKLQKSIDDLTSRMMEEYDDVNYTQYIENAYLRVKDSRSKRISYNARLVLKVPDEKLTIKVEMMMSLFNYFKQLDRTLKDFKNEKQKQKDCYQDTILRKRYIAAERKRLGEQYYKQAKIKRNPFND